MTLIKDSYDRYLAIRESFLQYRRYRIHDGDPPEDDDFYDEFLDEQEE
jgi:ABC-type transporter lipoprotein component MlaA